MEDLSNGQIDLMLVMLMAEATNTDPFEMGEELKEKELVLNPSTL